MMARNRKDGSSVQNGMPKPGVRSGRSVGTPTQGASITNRASKMPIAAAAMHPITMPITGPHMRRRAERRRLRPATTARVIRAVRGAANGSSRADPSSKAKTTEARVTDRIMITMPLTVGVTIRRRMTTHLDMTS